MHQRTRFFYHSFTFEMRVDELVPNKTVSWTRVGDICADEWKDTKLLWEVIPKPEDSIEIWYVDYNDEYYILSERQKQTHWVQNIIHNPSVLLTVEEKMFEGTVRLIDQEEDANLASQIANLMGAK